MTNTCLKIAVIGLGNIAKQHIENIISAQVQGVELVAVCSRTRSELSEEYGLAHYQDYKSLIDSKLADAVIIATPTMTHFEIAKYALQNNIHVMLEKPIGLSSFEGEQLITYQKKDTKFALMLNQRTAPVFTKMKSIVESGILGNIQRTHWTMTNWFRPEIYFQVSDWRATWRGEGGGLLVNQAIHNLDVFQWICGLPIQIRGFCEFGKYHDIEVEDEVTAYLKYQNGATGIFVASTGEAPGVNRLEIAGDKGALIFNAGKLTLVENMQSTAAFNKQTNDMFGMPDSRSKPVLIDEDVNQHALVMNNFINAILHEEALIAPASAGLASLDMANAMLLSTWKNLPVNLPLNRHDYQQHLDTKIQSSSLRAKSSRQANVDMSASYR
ncbi:Gfo/Idh/MocA family protein [Ningiella sp. W23]|uniref:Gfo/Idh/MocA family protein n=1 Tax=Ningiella sp. W23 TaxID=3023715 RepID=UPI003756F6C4